MGEIEEKIKVGMEWEHATAGLDGGDAADEQEGSFPVINDLASMPPFIRFKCFSPCGPEIDATRCEAPDSDFAVWKRRRMETDPGLIFQTQVPRSCGNSMYNVRDRQHDTLKWLGERRATITQVELLTRFDQDRRLGARPSLACINFGLRLLADRQCHNSAILDLLDVVTIDCEGALKPSTIITAVESLMVIDDGIVSAARILSSHSTDASIPPALSALVCDRLISHLQTNPSKTVAKLLCSMFKVQMPRGPQKPSTGGNSQLPSSGTNYQDISRMLSALRCALPLGCAAACADLFVQYCSEINENKQRLPLAVDTANSILIALCNTSASGGSYDEDEDDVDADDEQQVVQQEGCKAPRAAHILSLVKACARTKLRLSPAAYEAIIVRTALDKEWRCLVYLASMVIKRSATPLAIASACRLVVECPDLLRDARSIFKQEASAYVVKSMSKMNASFFAGASAQLEELVRAVSGLCILQKDFRSALDLASVCRQHAPGADSKEVLCAIVATSRSSVSMVPAENAVDAAGAGPDESSFLFLPQLVDLDVPAVVSFLEGGREACMSHLSSQPLFIGARDVHHASFPRALKALAPRNETYVMLGDCSLLIQIAARPEVQAAVTAMLAKYDGTAAGACLVFPSDALIDVFMSRTISSAVKQSVFQLVEKWLLRGLRWLHIIPLSFVCQASQEEAGLRTSATSAPGTALAGDVTLCRLMQQAQRVHPKVALLTDSVQLQQYARDSCGLQPVIVLADLLKKLGS